MPRGEEPLSRDDRVNEAIAAYIEAVERGETPETEEFLGDHADVAPELKSFFANQAQFHEDAGSLLPVHGGIEGGPGRNASGAVDASQATPRSSPPTCPGEGGKSVASPAEAGTPTEPTMAFQQSGVPSRKEVLRYFGEYELLEEIARGGMGVVYRARQVRLNRIVAVKMILSGQLASPEDVERFLTEAEAAAKLDHPGIVPIYEVGQHEGQHYFSMGFVDGQSLSTRVAQGPLPAREAAEIVRTVANAVQYAHENGVVHRDLKPGNVLLDSHGKPRITDFGLAKLTESRSDLTGTGQVLGTPGYMPPEQAAAQASAVGHLSDLYSLGAILYCLLTGRPPFQAASKIETLLQVQKQEPIPPRQLNPAIPLDLDTIVLKCLEKSPARRYTTAQEVAAELQRFLDGRPIVARPVGSVERTWRWCRRNPAVAGLMTTVALCLIGGTAVSTYFAIESSHNAAQNLLLAGKEGDARGEAEKRKREADVNATIADQNRIEAEKQGQIAAGERDHARDSELIARRHLYASQMNLAHQAWEVGHAARALQLLEGQRPKFDQDDLRSFDWYYLWRLCHSRYRLTLSGHKGAVYSVAFSPDGKTLASGSDDLTVRVWDVATRQERGPLRGHTSGIRSVVFSPDGATLASGSLDSTVILWDVDAGRERFTLKGHTDYVFSVAFSPDGETVASGSRDGTVKVWDVAKGQERLTLKHSGEIKSVAFSPDGKALASGGANGGLNVKVWDAATGEERYTIHTNGVRSVAFSPDSNTLASGHWDLTVKLWDVATGQQRSIPKWHGGGVACVAFSPDGKTVASASDDRTVKLWDLVKGQEQVQPHVGPVNSVAFSPDGKTLASGSEDCTVKLWDLGMGSNIDALAKHEGSVRCVAFSPDSKTLATRSDEQSVTIWDVATGQERVTLKGHTDNKWQLLPVAFSPDGKTLASASGDTVKLWNVATGEERRILKHSSRCLAFFPDGRTLASGGGLTVTLWDVATGQEQGTLIMEQLVGSVAFAPDGQTLATGLGSRVTLWDTATRRARLSLPSGSTLFWIWSVAFSPDGRTLAAARFDGTVMLWNPETGQLRASLKGHTAITRSVTYHPDGKTLATGSEDGTVKVWDAVTGQERVTLKGHTWVVCSVAFSPDGQTLATGSADGTVKLWRAAADKEALALKTELDPDDPDSPVADNDSGDRLGRSGRSGEAEEAYRQAMRRLEKLVVEFPDIPDYPQELARSHFALGLLFGKSNRLHEAEQAYRKVIELKPDSSAALNNIAWILVTCSDPKFRDVNKALELAKRAVELVPQSGENWNTLGVARYRAGDWKDAIESLEKSAGLKPGQYFRFNGFFLAMAHWQMDENEAARKSYDQAVEWMEKNKPQDEELRRIRAEAADLLGAKEQEGK